MAEAGSVWVSVLPSMRGFVSKVNAELKKIGDVEVTIKLNVDTKAAQAKIREATKGVVVDVGLNVDTAKAKAKIDETTRDRDVTVNVDADTGGAAAKLTAFSVTAKKLAGDIHMNVDLDVGGALAKIGMISAATLGVAAGIHTIGLLGPVVSGAVGAAALLPAVLVAGGAAAGTLAIGMHGVGDAVKNAFDPANAEKFNAAMAKLAPNARSTVTAIQGMGPAFTSMRLEVQNALFAGMGTTLSSLGQTYLPIARAGFTTMATEINDSTVAFGQFLLQTDTVASLRAATDNVTAGFHNLVFGGMDPALQSITTLATVGSAQLPGIGSAIAEVLSYFNEFIQRVASSGQLSAFFDAAVKTLGTLFQLVGSLGSIFISVFSAASQSGTSLLTVLNNGAGALAGFLSSAQGMDLLKSIFGAVAQTLQLAMPLFKAIGSVLVSTVLPAVVQVLPQIGAALGSLAPAIAPLGQALAAMAPVIGVVAGVIAGVLVAAVQALAPIMVQLAPVAAQLALALGTALLAAIQALAPVLQFVVPIISGIVSALSFLAPIIGPLAVAIGIIAGAFALVSAAVSAFTVVVAIFEAVFSPIGIIILLVIGVIALLAAAVYLIINNWSTISTFFVNLWNTVSGAFMTAWNGILNFLTTVWGAIWSTVTTVWNGIINFFTTVFNGVWNTITTVWNGILNFFTTVFNAIWSVIMTVWNGITNYFTSLFNAHRELIMQVWGIISTFLAAIWATISGVATTVWNAISSFFSTIWNAIRNTATTVWNTIAAFFTAAFNAYKAAFTTIWNAISSVFMTVWNFIKNTAVTVWNAIVAFLTPAFNLFRSVFTTVWNAISSVFTTVWNAIRNTAVTLWNAISGFFVGAFNTFKAVFSGIWNTIAGVFTTIWNGIKTTAQNIWNGIIAVVKGAVNGVIDAANWMVDKVNIVLKFLLIPLIPKIPRMEAGGILTLAMGGIPALARGGSLGFDRVGGGFKTNGPRAIVGEGRRQHPEYVVPTDPMYRSRALDLHASLTADLYGGSGKGTAPGVADPGGTAMLASGGILGSIGGIIGSVGHALGDAAQWIGGGIAGIAGQIKSAISSMIPDGIFRGAGNWVVDKVVAAVQAMIAKATAAVGGGGGGGSAVPSGPIMAVLQATAAQFGWGGGAEFAALLQLVQHESGFNPNAANPTSTAYGLFQFLNSTWGGTGIGKTANPSLQALAGMRYIKSAYGDPINAWGKWQSRSPHWYDQGGVAGGSGIMMKKVIQPERVLSPRQTVAFEQLVPMLASMNVRQAAAVTGDYGSGGNSPVIGTLNATVPQGSSAEDLARAVTFQVRNARRGGVYG